MPYKPEAASEGRSNRRLLNTLRWRFQACCRHLPRHRLHSQRPLILAPGADVMFLKCSRIRCVGLALFLAGCSRITALRPGVGQEARPAGGNRQVSFGQRFLLAPLPPARRRPACRACCWPRAIAPSTSAS